MALPRLAWALLRLLRGARAWGLRELRGQLLVLGLHRGLEVLREPRAFLALVVPRAFLVQAVAAAYQDTMACRKHKDIISLPRAGTKSEQPFSPWGCAARRHLRTVWGAAINLLDGRLNWAHGWNVCKRKLLLMTISLTIFPSFLPAHRREAAAGMAVQEIQV